MQYITLLIISVALLFSSISPKSLIAQNHAIKKGEIVNEQLAAQHLQNEEFEKALILYKELFNKKPDPFYYRNYLKCLIELKEYDKAIKTIRKQIKTHPSTPSYAVDLGRIYHISEEKSKSEKVFQEAINHYIKNKQQIIDLANSFMIIGKIDYAIASYKNGKNRLGKTYSFSYELAKAYEKNGNYSLMVKEYLMILHNTESELSNVQSQLQLALGDDKDNTISKILHQQLLEHIQKNPSKNIFSIMLLWHSIQQKDFESALSQATSLTRRLNEDGHRIFSIADLSTKNKDYSTAISAYDYIIKKGDKNKYYIRSRINKLHVRYKQTTSISSPDTLSTKELIEDYYTTLSELGRSEQTIELIKDLAHILAFYDDNSENAIILLKEALLLPLSQEDLAECKINMADILLMSEEPWEATLLYSQVDKAFKNDPIGHKAKYKNAMLSFYIGEFNWAKAQLDVLKAATSKLIANDAMEVSLLINDNIDSDSTSLGLRKYATACLYQFRNKNDLAIEIFDSIIIDFPLHSLVDEILLKKAEIMITKQNYEVADSLLQKIIDNHYYDILADNALFIQGEINEYHLNNKEKAMEMYQKLLTDFSGSLFTIEARKRFRKLRGDVIN